VSITQVVMNVQTRQLRGESDARLVRAEELGDDVALGAGAVVRAAKRHLRHRPEMPVLPAASITLTIACRTRTTQPEVRGNDG
jgi:hypothetical protein